MTNQLTKDSNLLVNLMIQANQHRQTREYHQALIIYQELTGELGETSELSQLLASCYFQIGLYDSNENSFQEAVTWIVKAIELSPKNSQLYDLLGWFHSLGTLDYEAAIQAFRIAIDLNPNNVHALVSGAGLHGVPEEVITLEEAIIWLERAVQVEADNPSYHFNLGKLHHEAGQLSKAKQEWIKALSCPRPLEAALSTTISKLISDT